MDAISFLSHSHYIMTEYRKECQKKALSFELRDIANKDSSFALLYGEDVMWGRCNEGHKKKVKQKRKLTSFLCSVDWKIYKKSNQKRPFLGQRD